MTRRSRSRDTVFAGAAHRIEDIPELGLPEVALAGRSNVGKSSLLNALAGGQRIARVSRTPGRTRSINFYRTQDVALVDLPGYGYAKVPREERNRWKKIVDSYLQRTELKLVLLIVDGRVGATPLDLQMAEWLRHRNQPMLAVVTKLDKMGRNAARRAAASAAKALDLELPSVIPVSSSTHDGVKDLWKAVSEAVGIRRSPSPKSSPPPASTSPS